MLIILPIYYKIADKILRKINKKVYRSEYVVEVSGLKGLIGGKDKFCLCLHHGLTGFLFRNFSIFLYILYHIRASIVQLSKHKVSDASRITKGSLSYLLIKNRTFLTFIVCLDEAEGMNNLGKFFFVVLSLNFLGFRQGIVGRLSFTVNGENLRFFCVYITCCGTATHRNLEYYYMDALQIK